VHRIAGRIVAVADAFDAMTSDRPYRVARSVDQAITTLRLEYDRQFEGRLLDALEMIVRTDADYAVPSSALASVS
jgi:HD-GYP domain-containing protein (c-di-GMP phosphodiesterase class II)